MQYCMVVQMLVEVHHPRAPGRVGPAGWKQINVCSKQGFMHDKIIASHTCFGGHMDVNCKPAYKL